VENVESVRYLIIGAGPAGLMLWHHLRCDAKVLIDSSPGRYKVGESIVPEFCASEAVQQLLPKIQKLPSFTVKHGTTFLGPDSVAAFPLPKNRLRGSFHIVRQELEELLRNEWKVPVRDERVVSIDWERKLVVTNKRSYLVAEQIIDCSGPSMVVSQLRQEIEELWGIHATWSYFDIVGNHPERFWAEMEASGRPLQRYDGPSGEILSAETTEGWSVANTTILTRVRDGLWSWQIPLFQGRVLSFGLVSRERKIPEETYWSLAEQWRSPNYELRRRESIQNEPLNKIHVRNRFARRAKTAATMDYILIGDAFAFGDPIFSTGVAVSGNKAIEVAELLNQGNGWSESKSKAYCSVNEVLFERATRAFEAWYSDRIFEDPSTLQFVQEEILEGRAFQANIAKHYGGVLADAYEVSLIRVDVRNQVAALCDEAGLCSESVGRLSKAERTIHGLSMLWSLSSEATVEIRVNFLTPGERVFSEVAGLGVSYIQPRGKPVNREYQSEIYELAQKLTGCIQTNDRSWRALAQSTGAQREGSVH